LIIYKKIFSKNQEIILKNVKIIEKSARWISQKINEND
jgi:hypothetical protein